MFSFWVGNLLLVVLNVPLIGVWVKLLQVLFRYMYPAALFFIAIGVYSINHSLFEVTEVMFFGVAGAVFLGLGLPVAPVLLGYVLGPQVEENFRRALLLSRGDLAIFVDRPISAAFIAVCALVVTGQVFLASRKSFRMTTRTTRVRLGTVVSGLGLLCQKACWIPIRLAARESRDAYGFLTRARAPFMQEAALSSRLRIVADRSVSRQIETRPIYKSRSRARYGEG